MDEGRSTIAAARDGTKVDQIVSLALAVNRVNVQRVDTIRMVVVAALLLSCFSNGDHVLWVDFPIFLEPPAMLKTLLPGLFLLSLTVSACKVAERSEPAADPAPAIEPDVDNSLGGLVSLVDSPGGQPGPEAMTWALEPWTGDFDGMIQRRVIRALVTFSKTGYFLDGAHQKGIAYEALKAFETDLNQRLQTKNLKVHVLILPVARDQLIPGLVEGRGDIAAANLTITPGRLQMVDFSVPVYSDTSEILVTSRSAPRLEDLEDLAGQEIFVRGSSSFYESLLRLNHSFRRAGVPEILIKEADENLESEDILEMVNADLVSLTVVDRHIGEFWKQIFEHIVVREDLAVNTGTQIGWAFRKNSPLLRETVDRFIARNRKRTLLGNVLFKRYLQNTSFVRSSLSESELEKFRLTVELFRKYAGQYGFDWLMVAAQGYQESALDQSKRSPAGAIGVMQILRSTARDPGVNIPNIEVLEDNIHAGVKYLRLIADHYFDAEDLDPLNRNLFSFAAYNAGPTRISRLRKEAERMGLDPNQWFRNVEVVAAREIGRETVQYVSNIYKYYVSYRLLLERREQRSKVSHLP